MSGRFVDCAECNRGGNGNDPDKCACGWQIKRRKKGGCFLGTPIEAKKPAAEAGGAKP